MPAVSVDGSHSGRHTFDAAAAMLQRRAGDVDVVERQCAIADDLILLVPLAGDEHEIARLGGPDRLLDRRAAIELDDERRGRRVSARRVPAAETSPRLISSMIRSGSSERGLSEVSTTRSLSRPATAPISGRFVRSRSPPQPNTVIRRARRQRPRGLSRFFSASSVCA